MFGNYRYQSNVAQSELFGAIERAFSKEDEPKRKAWKLFRENLDKALHDGLFTEQAYNQFFAKFLQNLYLATNPNQINSDSYKKLGELTTAAAIRATFKFDGSDTVYNLPVSVRKIFALYSFGKMLMITQACQRDAKDFGLARNAISQHTAEMQTLIEKDLNQVMITQNTRLYEEPDFKTIRQDKITNSIESLEGEVNKALNTLNAKQQEASQTYLGLVRVAIPAIPQQETLEKKEDLLREAKRQKIILDAQLKELDDAKTVADNAIADFKPPIYLPTDQVVSVRTKIDANIRELENQNKLLLAKISESENALEMIAQNNIVKDLLRSESLKPLVNAAIKEAIDSSKAQTSSNKVEWKGKGKNNPNQVDGIPDVLAGYDLQEKLANWLKYTTYLADWIASVNTKIGEGRLKIAQNLNLINALKAREQRLLTESARVITAQETVDVVKLKYNTDYTNTSRAYQTLKNQALQLSTEIQKAETQIERERRGEVVVAIQPERVVMAGAGPAAAEVPPEVPQQPILENDRTPRPLANNSEGSPDSVAGSRRRRPRPVPPQRNLSGPSIGSPAPSMGSRDSSSSSNSSSSPVLVGSPIREPKAEGRMARAWKNTSGWTKFLTTIFPGCIIFGAIFWGVAYSSYKSENEGQSSPAPARRGSIPNGFSPFGSPHAIAASLRNAPVSPAARARAASDASPSVAVVQESDVPSPKAGNMGGYAPSDSNPVVSNTSQVNTSQVSNRR